jgi:hypothetical protein
MDTLHDLIISEFDNNLFVEKAERLRLKGLDLRV